MGFECWSIFGTCVEGLKAKGAILRVFGHAFSECFEMSGLGGRQRMILTAECWMRTWIHNLVERGSTDGYKKFG